MSEIFMTVTYKKLQLGKWNSVWRYKQEFWVKAGESYSK